MRGFFAPSFRDAPLGARPGIHTHDRGYGFRARSLSDKIDVVNFSQSSRPGMTAHVLRMQSSPPRRRRHAMGFAEQFGELFGDGTAEFFGIHDGDRAPIVARHIV